MVWVKKNPYLIEHNNNGSWHIVGANDALKVIRYVLLKQIEQMGSESARDCAENKSPIGDSVTKEAFIRKLPGVDIDVASKNNESEYSTSTNSGSSTDTIINILSEMGVNDEEDDLDLWSSSPGGDNNKERNAEPRLDACCWEYKLLLPLDLE